MTPAAPRHTQPTHTHMHTVTKLNINTMANVIKAMDCIPQSYALRNEAIVSVTFDEYEIVSIEFPAMRMNRVHIPTLGVYGWIVEGWNTVFLEK